jgi:site-specific recombinase XerD
MIVVRCGKGGKRRLAMMDAWGWKAIQPWLAVRLKLRPGQIFCVLSGPTEGRGMHDSDVRRQLRELQDRSGVRRRVAAHQMRHSHAVDLQREGLDLLAIQAQLGHAHPGVTMVYLRSIAVEERLAPIGARKPPMMVLPT